MDRFGRRGKLSGMGMTALDGWENFYVIVGSSAGALIGLQFVVMTLLADVPLPAGSTQASQAFGTPNVVHFGAALLLSAIVSAPWEGIGFVAVLWGLMGAGGVVYCSVVARRMRSQTAYRPVLEDWLFHALLPLAAYATLAGTACIACWHTRVVLFAVGAAALLLLFVGIHNAWDAVVWHVFFRKREQRQSEK
jgi:hypothetical protein